MPSLTSPGRYADHRQSYSSSSTVDREATLNSLSSYRRTSVGDRQRSGSPQAEKPLERHSTSDRYVDRFSDRYSSLTDKSDRRFDRSPASFYSAGDKLSDRSPSLRYKNGDTGMRMSKGDPLDRSDRYSERTSERKSDRYSDYKQRDALGERTPSSTKEFYASDRKASTVSRRSIDNDDDEVRVKVKKKVKKRKHFITANLSGTRYEVIKQMAESLGFSTAREEDPNCYLIWNDSFVSTERISELKPYQRINHFPGMGEICRKDCLARNMAKMAKNYPDDYSFVPKTWIFPQEYGQFQNYAKDLKKKKKSRVFIIKPANGAMGNGISLCKNAEKISQNDHNIVQEYIDKPFLVDGYKCDMRIYVLVTSCDPLRIFLFNDGLLRMSTEKYIHPTDGNLDQIFMHLTNYSVNKHNDNFDRTAEYDTGSKRSLKWFNDYLKKNGYDVAFMWKNVTDLIIKTLIVAQPHVLHAYRMCRPGQPASSDSVCFEVLGFDVMLDRRLRPWLLEINRSPSFGTDERLDYEIKSGVILDSLRLLNVRASDKRKNMAAQKAQAQKRLLRPTKRIEGDCELEKKRQSVERKKEELKDLLARMRKDSIREDYENRNCGHFKRIFPPDDRFKREQYAKLMSEAFGIFLCGRASTLQQEVMRTYGNALREEDILDMIAQCETDDKDGKVYVGNKPPKGPKPLSSMPTVSKDTDVFDQLDETAEDDSTPPFSPTLSKNASNQSLGKKWGSGSRPSSTNRRPSSSQVGGGRGLPKATSLAPPRKGVSEIEERDRAARELEEENTKKTLSSLNDMRIKFPGKTDEEADYTLDQLHENWKYHKPRIASYWLVKLDSIKRRKVIDIVRSNVRAVLQRTWRTSDVDNLRLYRVFNRVFNRLLWSHGQGLWNCFQNSVNSWETIFSKSTDSITESEMNCCRRIVQLCRDCLLIVYQFAADAKSASGQNSTTHQTESSTGRESSNSLDSKPPQWQPNQTMSQRMTRLYQKRTSSANSLNAVVS